MRCTQAEPVAGNDGERRDYFGTEQPKYTAGTVDLQAEVAALSTAALAAQVAALIDAPDELQPLIRPRLVAGIEMLIARAAAGLEVRT